MMSDQLSTTDGITPIHLTENDAIIFAMIKADDDKKVLIACYLELLIRATIISMHLRSLFDFFFFFLENCGAKERQIEKKIMGGYIYVHTLFCKKYHTISFVYKIAIFQERVCYATFLILVIVHLNTNFNFDIFKIHSIWDHSYSMNCHFETENTEGIMNYSI